MNEKQKQKYINNISRKIKQNSIFRDIPQEKINKFLTNIEILIENIEFLNISVFEGNKLRFTGSIENDVRRYKNQVISYRKIKVCNRILRHSAFLHKLATIETFFNKPKHPDVVEDCIKRRVIPFILQSSRQIVYP